MVLSAMILTAVAYHGPKMGPRIFKPLPRRHLDLAVDARNHLELALIGTPLVARNGAIVALGEHDAGKHAGRFLDDVAAGRDDRPVGVGDRLAAAFADELEGDQRRTMA